MKDLAHKRAVVVGLGKSGLAAVRLLAQKGAKVVANDARDESALGEAVVHELRTLGATLALGGHDAHVFAGADLIVVSPGVPPLTAVRDAQARGVTVASEIELAAWFVTSTIVGITGTNGKSTVTTLVSEMAKRTGRPTFVGGNLGTPLVDVVGTPAADIASGGVVVVELSSFQLEHVAELHCEIAVLLNVTDDHLDRYESFAAYAAAKGRIFSGQRQTDLAVVPHGDELCLSLARAGRAYVATFGGDGGEVRVRDGFIVDEAHGFSFDLRRLKIRGAHNVLNACAATLVARHLGVSNERIAEVLSTFEGLAHRMVLVRELDGVAYYDDSKATNVGAAVAAIDGLDPKHDKLVLIAGGVDKGGSYGPLRERLEARARAVVLIGEAAPIIRRAMQGSSVPVVDATSLEDAITQSRALAQRGDAVLLAPACASFDMFRSYAHRGDEMQRIVRAFAPREGRAS